MVRLWEHVPIDEAVGTVVTALTETAAPGPANTAGQAGPVNTGGPGNPAGPGSPADAAEPPNRIPPATDDSLG